MTFVGGERRNPHNSRSGEILIVKYFGRFSSFKDSADTELLQCWYTRFYLEKDYVGSSPTSATTQF